MKGSQLLLVGLLLLIIGGVAAYLFFVRDNNANPPAAYALPEGSIFAYQGQKPAEAMHAIEKLPWYKTLRGEASAASFEKDFRFFDSLVNNTRFLKKALASGPVVVSLHVSAASDYNLLTLDQTNGNIRIYDLENAVKENDADARAIDHTFEQVKVYEFFSGHKEKLFACALTDGILAISHKTELVEEAIHAYNSAARKRSSMIQAMEAGLSQEKVYVNFGQLPQFIKVFTNPAMAAAIDGLAMNGAAGAYDVQTTDKGADLSGAVTIQASALNGWQALLHQQPRKSQAAEVLPQGTAIYMSWCTDSFGAYRAAAKKYLEKNGEAQKQESRKKETTLQLGFDPFVSLSKAMGKEWGYAALEQEGAGSNEILYIKADDTVATNAAFARLTANDPSFHETYKTFIISKLHTADAFGALLGRPFEHITDPYYTLAGGYYILSPELRNIEKCVEAISGKQTLATAASYKAVAAKMQESNFCLYINPARAAVLAEPYIKNDYLPRYRENENWYKLCSEFVLTLSRNGDHFNSNIIMQAGSGKNGASETVFSLQLEADMAGTPHIVANYETGQKDIMVQDKNNTLYLVDSKGGIIFKKKMGEPVQGDVYGIDLYKNNETEYLFTTQDKIYLLNNRGEDAGNYPLNLPQPTHTGLAVFDWNNDKEYTYLVCCDKGSIYGYYGNGKLLNGWLPLNADAPFAHPVQTFKEKGKNYVYGVTLKGTLYAWTDKGSQAMKPAALKAGIKNPVFYSDGNFYTCDSNGTACTVSVTGTVKKKNFSKFRNSPFYFFQPKNEKGKAEQVLAGGMLIEGFTGDSAEAFKLITSEKIVFPVAVITVGQGQYTAYISAGKGKMYLFNALGVPFSGFPKTGNTSFAYGSLSGNNDMDIIVGGAGKMLYHYRLSD